MNDRQAEILAELRQLADTGSAEDAGRVRTLHAEYRRLSRTPAAPSVPTQEDRWAKVIQMRRGFGPGRVIA